MPTANEKILDESISHAVDLQGYSNGVVNKIIKLLNKVDADLMQQITESLESLPQNKFNVERLTVALKAVREVNSEAYARVSTELDSELKQLTEYETGIQKYLLESALPVPVGLVSVNQVYAAAMAEPFSGKLLKEFMAGMEVKRMANIEDAIRIGYVEGQTINEMVKRIRGTKALKYADGLLEVSRRDASAIVRTAINHTSSFAREAMYEKNSEVIKGIRYTATLDLRTTTLCASRDGNVYKLGAPKPAIPAHINCRSLYVAVTKSWKELDIDAEELPASTRASLDGQVPASLTYQNWLKKQSAQRQDAVLGKEKAQLFRDGKLTLDKFVNERGHVYSIAELKALNPNAFNKKVFNFEPSEGLTAAQRKIETDFFNEIRTNEAGLILDYRRMYGNTVDPDLAKTLNAEFRKDLSLVGAVHEPSSYIAKSIFTNALQTKKRTGDTSPTIFTAGGSGSGKSATMPKALEALNAKEDGLVLDSVLSNFKSATSKIDEALRLADGDVAIVYTNTPLEKAFGFNALRARSVDIPTLSRAHIGASNTIKELKDFYADNPRVKILIMNNAGSPADVKFGSIADVPKYDPKVATQNLESIATNLLNEGKIDKNKFKLLVK